MAKVIRRYARHTLFALAAVTLLFLFIACSGTQGGIGPAGPLGPQGQQGPPGPEVAQGFAGSAGPAGASASVQSIQEQVVLLQDQLDRISAVARAEFHPHPIEEEDVAVAPDFDRDQLAQQHEVAVAQCHPFLEHGGHRVRGAFLSRASAERRAIALIRRCGVRSRSEHAGGKK